MEVKKHDSLARVNETGHFSVHLNCAETGHFLCSLCCGVGVSQSTMSEKSFQPSWVLYVYCPHELIQCLSYSWYSKWCSVYCPFLPTSVGTVVLTGEKGEIGLENKKGWGREEGAWSPGIWLWHGLWCERHGTEEQGHCQSLAEGGRRESAHSSFRRWHSESTKVFQVMVINVLRCVWMHLCCTGVSRQKEKDGWWECYMHRSAG